MVVQGCVKDLEFLFYWSEVELVVVFSDKCGLESDVVELWVQLVKVEDGYVVVKKQLEKEMLMCVDLENCCQSLQEELDFWKSVFEEEVWEMWWWYEWCLVEVDSSWQQEYDFKMVQVLEELWSQYDE